MAAPGRQSPDVFLLCFRFMRSKQEQIKMNRQGLHPASLGLTKSELRRAKMPHPKRIGLFQAKLRR
jgi:hypothetical protein